ncbi:methyltransferase domain-containing protein [Bradyrhizobium brasilense]|uniref:class I SAM-dependent methyltransferase n=1 Tax=Bradyrhizobium brasilense TaxID=1419277 RepID=UPI0024B22832|nr:class I SAM-dependent methyltransferase [Bradyrhizobium australafricanum]WFU30387.1 methyltransferase domain-containing protein [Bradyrhizobium australafricanum]
MTDNARGGSLEKLHIGAFNCGIDGWINTDITMHLWIARVPFAAKALHLAGMLSDARYAEHRQGRFAGLRHMNLTRPLPFADRSLSAVFSAHVFEHLFPDEVERLAREIARVLAPGGVCRIVVPDMERIVALYDPAAPQAFLKGVFEIDGRKEAAFAHHWGFTRASLAALFRNAGCSETYIRAYREGVCPDIDRLDNRPDESIFFEAIK